MPKRYIVVLVFIAVVFLAGIALLISLLTGDGAPEEAPRPGPVQQTAPLSTETRSVTYTIYGPLVGDEERRAVRIIINENERRAEILQGYQETVVRDRVLANNAEAFEALVLALEGAGYDERDDRVTTDERAVCPLGNTFVYEAAYGSDQRLRSWSTSCHRREGSFKGDASTVRRLMENQIPEFREFARDVRL